MDMVAGDLEFALLAKTEDCIAVQSEHAIQFQAVEPDTRKPLHDMSELGVAYIAEKKGRGSKFTHVFHNFVSFVQGCSTSDGCFSCTTTQKHITVNLDNPSRKNGEKWDKKFVDTQIYVCFNVVDINCSTSATSLPCTI